MTDAKSTAVSWFLDQIGSGGEHPALIWRDTVHTYDELTAAIDTWRARLRDLGLVAGDCVAIHGEYSFDMCSLLLALVANNNIVVPLEDLDDSELCTAEVTTVVTPGDDGDWTVEQREVPASVPNPLLVALRDRGTPGLVLFTSGSTGEKKAVLHDLSVLLDKYRRPGRPLRSLVFLSMSHIGGVNTLLYLLANKGTVVTCGDRSPRTVCAAIDRHHVEVLPTSPTFLNMLLVDRSYESFDLTSLALVTYGTEPMPPATLRAMRAAFPDVVLKQTYGLTELGILPTRSEGSDSLWMKLGGQGWETKVVNGTLRLRAPTAMLGYLNAPSPFDQDGWYDTEDEVVVSGDDVQILGRRSEIINVGGEKVYPAEVESVVMEVDNVAHATVRAHPNPLMGNVVAVTVGLVELEDMASVRLRIKSHCARRLPRFKVPVLVELGDLETVSTSLKKLRGKQRPTV